MSAKKPHQFRSTGTSVKRDFEHIHMEDKSNLICGKQSSLNSSLKINTESKIEQEKSSGSMLDEEKIMINYYEANDHEDENSFLNSYWSKSHLISSTEKQIRQENAYQEKLKDGHKSNSGMKANTDSRRGRVKEEHQTLEERNLSSQYASDG